MENTSTLGRLESQGHSGEHGEFLSIKYHYNIFMFVFHKVLELHKDEILDLGIKSGYLGYHSDLKGAWSFLSEGCTVSPPI